LLERHKDGILTADQFLETLNRLFVVALVLLNLNQVLLSHRLNLVFYLCSLQQFIDLDVDLFQLSNQVEVLLL